MKNAITLLVLLPIMTCCSDKQDIEIIKVTRITPEMVPALLASIRVSSIRRQPRIARENNFSFEPGMGSDAFVTALSASRDWLDEHK
jgi:hypothetical protein